MVDIQFAPLFLTIPLFLPQKYNHMQYPIISEYKESIMCAEDNFATLKNLRPVFDSIGQPIMSSGNFAVVFKMKDVTNGKLYAIKCFLKNQEGRAESYISISKQLKWMQSSYILHPQYLDFELFVDTRNCTQQYFPILIMEWVDGITLGNYIKENIDNKYLLESLAYRFSFFAKWLIPAPIAHGDLKPDNILINEKGDIVLVDYDGMYVPEMKGQKARELGSPDYQLLNRNVDNFDERIDDFSIIVLLLSIAAISKNNTLYSNYGGGNRLLFSKNDYLRIEESNAFQEIVKMISNKDVCNLTSLFLEVHSNGKLSEFSYLRINIDSPVQNIEKWWTDKTQKLINEIEENKKQNTINILLSKYKANINNGINIGESYFALFLIDQDNYANHDLHIQYLERASSADYYDAKCFLSISILNGYFSSDKEKKVKAFAMLQECAKINNLNAICWLAKCYADGIGVPRDGNEALRLFTKAAYMNSSYAACALGHFYYSNIFGENGFMFQLGYKKDVQKSIIWFSKSAEENHHEACWWLSYIYTKSEARNIFLAKYYSDMVNKIQSEGNTSIRSINVIDTFNENESEFVKYSESELNIDEMRSLCDIISTNDNGNIRFIISCKEVSEKISFTLTHHSKVTSTIIVPALITVIEYRKKNDYQSYYKLEYKDN